MQEPELEEEPPVSLWQKLVRQRIIQTLVLYIPIGWMLVEIATALSEGFDLPPWVLNGAMVLFIAGIPVAIFLAWAFQWTESGVSTDVKGWRGGIVLTVAAVLLFGVSAALYLNLRKEVLLENAGALTDPIGVVAVLPFVQQGVQQSQLGDTFALEITDRLSKHPDLYVLSSVATFAPALASLAPSGQQQRLVADYIVSGAISADEQGFVLNITLLNKEQQVLWQDDLRFGADADSQVGLQRRISRHVAEVLGTKYQSTEYCEPTDNLEALEAYHSAKLKINQRGREYLAEAEALLKKAIKLDPDYGHAYSALSVAYLLQGRWKPEYRSGVLAEEVARKALDRCPTLGVAYRIWVPDYTGIRNEWVDEELKWRDSLAMAPNDIWLLDNYALNLGPLGMGETEMKVRNRVYRLNPLDPRAIVGKAWMKMNQETISEALELTEEAERQGDKSCNVPYLRWRAGLLTSEEATIEAWENFPGECGGTGSGGFSAMIHALGPAVIYQARHQRDARRLMLDYLREHMKEMPNMAMLSAIESSDLDLAFDAIEYGLEHDEFLMFPAWWEEDEPTAMFRRDARFAQLVERLDYVDYWREFGWPDGKCAPFGDSFVCEN
jgi:TolB-like protein